MIESLIKVFIVYFVKSFVARLYFTSTKDGKEHLRLISFYLVDSREAYW